MGWPWLRNTKDSKLAELGGSPSVTKAASPAAPGDPSVPVEGERQCGRPSGKAGQPGPPLLSSWGKSRTSWTPSPATLFGFLSLPDFCTQQETLKMVNGWFPFVGNT